MLSLLGQTLELKKLTGLLIINECFDMIWHDKPINKAYVLQIKVCDMIADD